MQIVEEKQNDIYVFKLIGRLDSTTSPEFEKKISRAIADGFNQILVDFEKLEYLSSSGLRVLLKVSKLLKKSEGKLVLCSMADYIKEIFEISGFDTFLPILDNVNHAIKQF